MTSADLIVEKEHKSPTGVKDFIQCVLRPLVCIVHVIPTLFWIRHDIAKVTAWLVSKAPPPPLPTHTHTQNNNL